MTQEIKQERKLSIELSSEGARGIKFDKAENSASKYLDKKYLRKEKANLPQIAEFETIRHFTKLSRLNFSIDTHFYPLGSCTMKYNPKSYDMLSALQGFTNLHPLAPDIACQGTLETLYEFEQMLKEITGLHSFTMQPAAGAHGEWTGVLMAQAYHKKNGETRTEIIVPDTAHGTNPASASMGGFSVKTIKSAKDGRLDVASLKEAISKNTALVMLTVPNTVGLFEKDILEIADIIHDAGSLFYLDGANFNALIGNVKPADFGADIMHLNLHKTFAAPHGGGGPGSGVVGVCEKLESFLPVPRIVKEGEIYKLNYNYPNTIGRVKGFHGNIGVILRSYFYLKQHDVDGLKEIAENAIINANYLKEKLKKYFPVYFDYICMHECVLTIDKEKFNGVKTLDIAKRLLDYGYYAPTIYFPLIVPEALMIEPTETEGKKDLDGFIDAMIKIHAEIMDNPDLVKGAPYTMPVKRIDEVSAARNPNMCWSAN
jgi:glycine dehydrogenase subunit 2